MSHATGIRRPTRSGKIREFALLFWANRGNHNENTGQKFLPTFTFEELKGAASRRWRMARSRPATPICRR